MQKGQFFKAKLTKLYKNIIIIQKGNFKKGVQKDKAGDKPKSF